MDSILTSIKKLLGITEDYEQFDNDIVMHINSVLAILSQLGVGPSDGFFITDKSAIWDDFIDENVKLNDVKSYMFLKVKMMFDPPSSSAIIDSYNRMISEFEWRCNVEAESGGE